MSFTGYYKLSFYCLFTAAFLAVAAAGTLGPIALMLCGSALVAGAFIDTARLRRAIPGWVMNGVTLACLPACYLDFKLQSHSLLISALHLILFVAGMRLLTRHSDRDYGYLYLLSFGALLAAAALTINLIFLLCLLLFLATGISSLILLEMNRSATRALIGGMIQPVVVPRSLRGTGLELFAGFPSRALAVLTLVLTASIIALAVPLFFLLPRVSLSVHHPAASQPEIISGFSETVELGAIGRIKESNELVMKVKVDAPSSQLPPDLKWRGIALDHFDGRSWSRSRSDRNQIPTQAGYFKLQEAAQGTDVIVQTFLLQPIATDIVFGSHRVLAVSSDLGWIGRDASDNIYSLTQRTSAIRYSVVSDITRPDPRLIAPHPGRPPREIEVFCLQVPQEDPRVADLARRVTAGAGTLYDKARALESFLRTSYGYSLELKGTPNSSDPLAMFLFEVRRGHCEYFATAMAVMLRQLGIPSRLINGFRAGELNRLSGHWTVRQSDAHSWVEAWFPPYGWVEFDPTPAEPESHTPAFLKTIASLLDALDLWWSDDVVNFDVRKQSRAIQVGRDSLDNLQLAARGYVREAGQSLGTQLAGLRAPQWVFSLTGMLAASMAALLLVGIFLRRRPSLLRRLRHALGGTRIRRNQHAVIIGFYADAVDMLRRHGLERRRGQTPIEFARDLPREPFGDALTALTAIYNRIRFGRLAHEGDLAQARELLRSLRIAKRQYRL